MEPYCTTQLFAFVDCFLKFSTYNLSWAYLAQPDLVIITVFAHPFHTIRHQYFHLDYFCFCKYCSKYSVLKTTLTLPIFILPSCFKTHQSPLTLIIFRQLTTFFNSKLVLKSIRFSTIRFVYRKRPKPSKKCISCLTL